MFGCFNPVGRRLLTSKRRNDLRHMDSHWFLAALSHRQEAKGVKSDRGEPMKSRKTSCRWREPPMQVVDCGIFVVLGAWHRPLHFQIGIMRATSFLLVCLVLFAAVLTSASHHGSRHEVDGSQYETKPARRQNFIKRAWKGVKNGAAKVGNAAMNALPAVQNTMYTGMQVMDTVNQGRYMVNSMRGSSRRRGRYLRDAKDEE
ncbi:hypothetical protein AC1031_021570 [Aphanomyces cochlioides]|nr:hypothetical protein AC1031_021570 [Aphanomyces cochlioides]